MTQFAEPSAIQHVSRLKSGSLSFVQYLAENLRDHAPKQKGARTQARLELATAKMLGKKGYYVMRVSDITESAGLAEGSFYVYFDDKKHASLTVLAKFLKDFVDSRAPPEAVRSPFESIRTANRRWLALCRANTGVMRCVFQAGDEDPDFARLVQRTARNWYERLSRSITRDQPRMKQKPLLLAMYLMCSMMDEMVRKLVVYPDREFQRLLRSMRANDNMIADVASLIWLRVFDPSAACPNDLAPPTAEFARMVWKRGNSHVSLVPRDSGKNRPLDSTVGRDSDERA